MKLALVLLSTVLSLLVVEGAARVFIKPSVTSYGTLFGRDLPPLRVIRPRIVAASPAPAAETDETPIGSADFQGVFREDRVLGYAPRERTSSPHGWWIANNIGARSTVDTAPAPPPGRRRMLVLGESYGCGSRVRQEDAWPTVLGRDRPDLEVVNLAVDGYGMGQSLLRFREVTRAVDYDVAMLVFVPTADLWRDVNTVRSLVHRSWNSYTVMPRFVLEEGRLVLVPSLYEVGSDVYADNASGLRDTLREHLRTYDRFYFPAQYEPTPVVGHLVLSKLVVAAYAAYRKGALLRSMSVRYGDLDGEAIRVSRAIFVAMRDEARARGKRFILTLLPEPHELPRMRGGSRVARKWASFAAAVCEGLSCIDVAPALLRVPAGEVDRGYDNTHYGPRVNHSIAAAVEDGVRRLEDRAPAAPPA